MALPFATIDEFVEDLNRTKEWFYRNSRFFDPAKVRVNGRPLKPIMIDVEKARQLLTGDFGSGASEKAEYRRSLTIKSDEKRSHKSSKTRVKEKLWL